MNDVEQIDRDAAADFTQGAAKCDPNKNYLVSIRNANLDDAPVVQAFAAHRNASIRAFLEGDIPDGVVDDVAAAIAEELTLSGANGYQFRRTAESALQAMKGMIDG